MNGINDAGSLNAYILINGGTLPSSPDWSTMTNMGNTWNVGYLTIPSQSDDFQVRIQKIKYNLVVWEGSLILRYKACYQ